MAASSKSIATFGQIYDWDGRSDGRDEWQSEPLDILRELAVEMMQWLAQRAAERVQKGCAQ